MLKIKNLLKKKNNLIIEVNKIQVDFSKLPVIEKKDKAIAIWNLAKFFSYFYLLSKKYLIK